MAPHDPPGGIEFHEGAQVITEQAVDRITDRAFEAGWREALSAIELRIAVRGSDPIGVGQKNERERILTLVSELRSRYADAGKDRYGT